MSSAVGFLIFASTATSSASSSAAMPAAGLAGDVAGADRGEHRLGLTGGDVLLRLSREQFGQQPLEPVDGLDPAPGQLLAAVGQHPQRLELAVERQHPQACGADRDHRDRVRVVGVGLAVVAGVEQPDPGRELGRHVDDVLAVGSSSRCASGRPAPLLPSTAQTRSGHACDVACASRRSRPGRW